jgi:tRNA(Ile)-lysidine synthase
MGHLPDRFRAHVVAAQLFRRPGTAVVAVSGGADSVVLLDLLAGVTPELGLTLVVAHADHGIQAGSGAVARAERALAERYGLPFELGELNLGPAATETVARRARYAWLGEVLRRREARYVVTAHHQDDQAETVLLRALKGSAPAGLAGMPARGRGGLIRPLLPFTRAELAAHVAARGLPFYEDPANADPRHLRSWLRTALLPALAERLGARVRDDLLRLGRAAASERRAWDAVLELVPDLALHVDPHAFDVARDALVGYDKTLSVALLRAAARRTGLVLGPARARQLLVLARRPSGRRLPLGQGWIAEVQFDRLRVTRGFACAAEEVNPSDAQGAAVFGAFTLSWRPEAAPARVTRDGWTTWMADTDWQIRSARPGDRLQPLGGTGRRELRRVLMEARVPRGERAQYPVVARGETILWVPGICRCADALPAPGTRAVRVDVTHGGGSADRRA